MRFTAIPRTLTHSNLQTSSSLEFVSMLEQTSATASSTMSSQPLGPSGEAPVRIPRWSAADGEGFVRETRLCDQCLTILHPSRRQKCRFYDEPFENFKHHTTEEDLKRSVEGGCTICIRLQDFYHQSIADPNSPAKTLGDGSNLSFWDMKPHEHDVCFQMEDEPNEVFHTIVMLRFYPCNFEPHGNISYQHTLTLRL